MEDYEIAGQWEHPDDSSGARLEVADTVQPGMVAIRSSSAPDQKVFCTADQLTALAHSIQERRLRVLTGAR